MEYFISLAVLVGIYITLSSSFNLIIGFGGLVSIAHPIFFALGAYTTGLLAIHFQMHPVLAVLAGGGVAFLSSMMLSLPSLRISGDYLMITSIGLFPISLRVRHAALYLHLFLVPLPQWSFWLFGGFSMAPMAVSLLRCAMTNWLSPRLVATP
jgi:ABC-type branched-subunit amino acid transport system permease subunit